MANGFRISARAMKQLGAELITSDYIALYELIKNSIDAGSNRVTIEFEYPFVYHIDRLLEIAKAWPKKIKLCSDLLTSCLYEDISQELKCKIVEDFLNSQADSVDEALESIFSKYCFIKIVDTGCGMSEIDLQNAFLVIGTPVKWVEKQSQKSSKILGEKGIGRLSMMRIGDLCRVKSTKVDGLYWNYIDFNWTLFDDPKLYLDDIEIEVNRGAKKTNKDGSGTLIKISKLKSHWTNARVIDFVNKFIRRLQNPFLISEKRFPMDVKFNGENTYVNRMPEWFKDAANFQVSLEFNPQRENALVRKLKWHGRDSCELRTWSMETLRQVLPEYSSAEFERLSEFSVDGLWFNRSTLKITNIDINQVDFKKELNIWCGGYAIYRDNFRIGLTGSMEDDWLRMDEKSLKAQGFTFNRYQTVGSISISSKKNRYLIDSANRENLIECREFDLLREILGIFNQDLRSHIDAIKQAETKIRISEEAATDAIDKSKENLKKTILSINKIKNNVGSEHKKDLVEIRNSIKTHLEDVQKLEKAIDLARDQRVELLELAGVGLVVDKVIHELVRLTKNTSEYLDRIEKSKIDPNLSAIIKQVKQQIVATNKRIRTVDNLSPAGRNRKGVFDLAALVRTTLDGYQGRFERHNIKPIFLIDGKVSRASFNINMVVGLVSQVLENLLDNSLYWLQIGTSDESEKTIKIELNTKDMELVYSDNGPGIDVGYREEIFRPYFTTKKKGKGLGLFIARELAEYHKSEFYLDPTPDQNGRLRNFVLNMNLGK